MAKRLPELTIGIGRQGDMLTLEILGDYVLISPKVARHLAIELWRAAKDIEKPQAGAASSRPAGGGSNRSAVR